MVVRRVACGFRLDSLWKVPLAILCVGTASTAGSCGGPSGSPPAGDEAGSTGLGGLPGEGGTDAGGGVEPASGGDDDPSSSGGTTASGGASSSGGNAGPAGSPGTAGNSDDGGASPASGGIAAGGTPNGGADSEAGAPPANGGSDSGSGGTSPASGGTSSATGGNGGGDSEGGSPACSTTCGQPLMLDDFEDDDRSACIREEWKSDWWVTNDGTGFAIPEASEDLPVPLDPARAGSCMGVHVEGDGFTDWGVVVGLTFHNPDETVPRAVDLGEYAGIRLWLRGSGLVTFELPTVNTEVETAGGVCTSGCYDHFETQIQLPSSWMQIDVPFSSLRNEAQSAVTGADLQIVLALYLHFEVQDAFELWLDDPSFY